MNRPLIPTVNDEVWIDDLVQSVSKEKYKLGIGPNYFHNIFFYKVELNA